MKIKIKIKIKMTIKMTTKIKKNERSKFKIINFEIYYRKDESWTKLDKKNKVEEKK